MDASAELSGLVNQDEEVVVVAGALGFDGHDDAGLGVLEDVVGVGLARILLHGICPSGIGVDFDVRNVDGKLLIVSKEKKIQSEMIPEAGEKLISAGWTYITDQYSGIPNGNRVLEKVTEDLRMEIQIGAIVDLPLEGEINPPSGFTRGEGYLWLYGKADVRMTEFPVEALQTVMEEYLGFAHDLPVPTAEVEEYGIHPISSSYWEGETAIALLLYGEDYRKIGTTYLQDLEESEYQYTKTLDAYFSQDQEILVHVSTFNSKDAMITIDITNGYRTLFPTAQSIQEAILYFYGFETSLTLPIPSESCLVDLWAPIAYRTSPSVNLVLYGYVVDENANPVEEYGRQLLASGWEVDSEGRYTKAEESIDLLLSMGSGLFTIDLLDGR